MELKPRLNLMTLPAELTQPMMQFSQTVEKMGLEKSLMELVKIRASQINGCAFCLHMHSKDARAHGETEERLYLLNGWRESPLYTDRERAALAWTEAMTLVANGHPSDALYAELDRHFSDEEKIKLSMLIVVINGWNRLVAGARMIHPVEAARAVA